MLSRGFRSWLRLPLGASLLGFASLAAQQPLASVLQPFAPFDLDGDGVREIEALELLGEAGPVDGAAAVVFVEARLLRARPEVATATQAALRRALDRHLADLAAEGHRASLVAATVHGGPPHQDGRTLLALRRVLQALHGHRHLTAAVLVGHFPEALLVRTCNWRRQEPLELPGPAGTPVPVAATMPNVRSVPEFVAHRADIVLADLDGAWEQVYVPGPARLPAVTAVFGEQVPAGGGVCVGLREGELQVTDVFHLADGRATVDRAAFAVAIDDADRDHECTAADRRLGNPLAQPELAVSRLDARGVAWSPAARCLDADGRPQAVALAADEPAAAALAWHPDPELELRLLVEYFDRNHAYRTEPVPDAAHRPASIAWGLGSGLGSLREATKTWRGGVDAGCDVTANADLRALLAWLQRPAVLRTLRAHSNPFLAEFQATDAAALATAVGGPAWRWRHEGAQLVPTYAPFAGGHADFFFYRTLWQQRVLPAQPYLLVHTGCEAISPAGSTELPYDAPGYGERQHAEALLFFTPCLALVGRAKVFYDEPRGFAAALAAGATFGAAWQRYFVIEGAAASWDEAGGDIGRKRACFWSVLGDCTLRLR